MEHSTAISGFRRLPWAMMLSCVLIGALNHYVGSLEGTRPFVLSTDAVAYNAHLKLAAVESPTKSLIRLGNSRSEALVPHILSKRLLNADSDEVFSLSMGGSMPITYRILLDKLAYRCVRPGDTVLYCLTPMDLNLHNDCIQRTIMAFFSWKEFFSELVYHLRWEDITFFLRDYSLNLVKFRDGLKWTIADRLFSMNPEKIIAALEPDAAEIPGEEINREGVDLERKRLTLGHFEKRYYRDYTLDSYQIDALLYVVEEVRRRGAHVVLVLPPLSGELRAILGAEPLERFMTKVRRIAEDEDLPVLDYLTGYSGEEYPCFDASHLTIDARTAFTRKLVEDLKRVSAERGYPVLDVTIDPAHTTLRLDRERVRPGEPVVFEIDARSENAGRGYLLLGSASGREPGTYRTVVLPLNTDGLTHYIEQRRDENVFKGFMGMLDEEGKAIAVMTLPENLPEKFKDKPLTFAYFLDGVPRFVSNAVTIIVES